ncbi:MAG: integrase [Verrucomicrobiaceae bacterium]|nr:integrase [Verrucomicrobiaceae bacterium]
MALTDTAVRQAKPKEKPYKLSDSQGLYLDVRPGGSKLWRLKYRIAGKEKLYAIGSYPEISLSDARIERDKARKLIAIGTDPVHDRKEQGRARALADGNTFDGLATEWLAYNSPRWAKSTAYKANLYLKNALIPVLGTRPVAKITRPELVDFIRSIEKRETFDVAKKCRQWLNQIFRYALAKGLIQYNPATDLDIVAAAGPRVRHHPFVPPAELPALLDAVANYKGNFLTKCAVRLLMLTAVRPGELRAAPWSEFDLDNALWTIPADRMKMRRAHVVPLPKQAVAILRDLELLTGRFDLVFAGRNDPKRPMSENTINKCLGDLGYKGRQTGHGFRHMLSTELNGKGYNKDWIERQLAHGDNDEIRATYNHAQYIDQRRDMMQWWADRLEQLETSSNVIPVDFQRG